MQLTDEFIGLRHFEGFDNYVDQSWNTCGQAVIASVLYYCGVVPAGISRTDKEWKTKLTRQVFREHGPNWPLRNLVSNRRTITRALRAYGVPFREHVHPPLAVAARARHTLLEALERQRPVIVLLEVHHLGLGRRFTLHWAVVYAANRHGVKLSSWGKDYHIPWADFLDAWRIWFMTWPYHYYQIEVWKP